MPWERVPLSPLPTQILIQEGAKMIRECQEVIASPNANQIQEVLKS